MKRVLMTADAVGGVWTYAHTLCRTLDERGIHVTLAVMGPRPSRSQMATFVPLRNVEVLAGDFALEWMDDPWKEILRAGEWLLSLEAQVTPDVVHLNGYAHAALPFHAPTLVVAHSCVASRWRAVHGIDPPPRFAAYRAAVQNGLAMASAVVSPSRFMQDAIATHYGRRSRSTVIPHGLYGAGVAPGLKQNIVLSAGHLWDQAKNLTAVDAVAPSLPWAVRIAGSSVDPTGRVHMPDHARTLGVLSARMLAREMASASIFALPARYEPFGLTVLEAALSGCALVVGDIPSLRELWDGAATFVPPDDHDALREALLRLIDDGEARAHAMALARERARTYSGERMTAAYVDVYRRLSDGASAASQRATHRALADDAPTLRY
ncbi:MAG TPA: glycosyltransferase family 4 protein [Gemmatimonadaceae bacterium]